MEAKLFIDTMVFLHFRPLDEMELRTLSGAEHITLVLPRITLQELDGHKTSHKSSTVRERARRILAELESAVSQSRTLKGEILVEFFSEHPKEQLTKWQLNESSSDDVLLACALAYQARCEKEQIIIITDDTGLRLACRHCGMTAIAPDRSLALPEELSEIERDNRDLKMQIQRLENALPKLELVFSGLEEHLNSARFELSPHPAIDEQELSLKLARIREAYPKKTIPGTLPTNHPLAKFDNSALRALVEMDPNSIRPEEYTRYNRELDQFYRDVETHFRRLHSLQEPMSRTISFVLEIRNTGTAPADDVDVLIHFPDGFKLMSEDALPEAPQFPEPPSEPLSRAEALERSINRDLSAMYLRPQFPGFIQPTSFKIEETNSYRVSDHFHRIKHGFPVRLREMYIEFRSLSDSLSFNSTYELRPANLAEPVTGKLHFAIVVQDV